MQSEIIPVIRWLRYVNSIFAFIASASIAVMIFLTTADTTLRYVLNAPIRGTIEISEVALVVCIYLGIAWTQQERGHTRVALILTKLPPKKQVIFDILIWIICFIFLFIIGWETGLEFIRSYQISEFRWGSIQMPIWWAKGLVPLGCWMTCLQIIIDVFIDIKRLTGRLPLVIPDLNEIKE